MQATAPPLVRIALLFYAVLFAAAVGWAQLAERSLLFADAQAAARGIAPLRDAVAGALVGAASVLLSAGYTRSTRSGERLARALAALVGRLGDGDCLVLALVSGVAEEAFFRGAMQPQLGLVATSVVFALAHFVPRREFLPWMGFALAAGLALGWLFEATGNLLAPALAHAVVNAVNLRRLVRDYAPV